ncbi:MAG: hypothetical protein GJU73_03790 [Ferrovum sp.]|jgi:HemY protein|uniref:heme biosynthesis HemY N-terminal domain-containing protein n=1 Tax=Ferrovum sp. TaxID=2609467 RepID=UPI0026312F82|nr:heme biosynthesis HemY N-terminal domain-containing protein [Ferrovum sp.]MBW8066546.1 hypothetical protein [Ferrovum sp.]
MRLLLGFLLLFMLATILALSFNITAGYVLIVQNPWRIEISLSVFVLGLVLILLVLNLGGHMFLKVWQLPKRIRNYHLRRSRTRARSALYQGLTAYFSGHPEKAEKMASIALRGEEARPLCLMLAALAAHEAHHFEARDRYLDLAREEEDPETLSMLPSIRSRMGLPAGAKDPSGS